MNTKQILTLAVALIFALAVSAGLTRLLIISGLDWSWALLFNGIDALVASAVPFVFLGMIVPVGLPVIFYIRYKKSGSEKYRNLYRYSAIAFAISYVISTVLKVFTNRRDMEPFEHIGSIDFSDQFRFGFMNSNSWWESLSEGWPSGHTFVTVSMAIAMIPFLESKFWQRVNIIYPILIGLSVSIAFHWFSDVISGGLMGLAVGLSVILTREKQGA